MKFCGFRRTPELRAPRQCHGRWWALISLPTRNLSFLSTIILWKIISNLSSCEKKTWKKIKILTGFKSVTSVCLSACWLFACLQVCVSTCLFFCYKLRSVATSMTARLLVCFLRYAIVCMSGSLLWEVCTSDPCCCRRADGRQQGSRSASFCLLVRGLLCACLLLCCLCVSCLFVCCLYLCFFAVGLSVSLLQVVCISAGLFLCLFVCLSAVCMSACSLSVCLLPGGKRPYKRDARRKIKINP